jgi:hypothetical protein
MTTADQKEHVIAGASIHWPPATGNAANTTVNFAVNGADDLHPAIIAALNSANELVEHLDAIEALFGRPVRVALQDIAAPIVTELHIARRSHAQLEHQHAAELGATRAAAARHERNSDRLACHLNEAIVEFELRARRSGGKPEPAWLDDARKALGAHLSTAG